MVLKNSGVTEPFLYEINLLLKVCPKTSTNIGIIGSLLMQNSRQAWFMTNDENLHFNKISGDFCMVYEALFKGVFVKDTIFFIEDI